MKSDFPFTKAQLQILAGIGLLIVVGFSLLFSSIFVGTHRELVAKTERHIAEALDSLVEYERQHGLDKLIELAKSRSILSEEETPFISIRHESGVTILHTSKRVSERDAWSAAEQSIRSRVVGWGFFAHRVHVRSAPLTSGTLLVGESDAPPAQVRDRILLGFSLLLTAALGVALLASALLSRGTRRAVDEMISTLYSFAAGDVDRRVLIPSVSSPLADLGQAINASLDYSRTLVQNLNNTSSDIAHNLKKPLTRLRQRLETASKCDAGNPEFSRKIEEGIEEIDALVKMFEALLNFGQLQSGDWRSRFVDVDMAALTAHIVDIYDPIVSDHGLKLQSFIAKGPMRFIKGDRELLMEMIVNFLENCIQYCPPGTTVSIDMRPSISGLNIVIRDNGPGVPASEIDNLFERFYRLEVSRDKPGHGLGIPFAVAIAELHGARIELSDNKPGLNVFIHFPKAPRTNKPPLGLRLRSGYVVKGLMKR